MTDQNDFHAQSSRAYVRWRIIALLLATGYGVTPSFAQSPKREFRGVWVATVANIDWPSKPGISTDAQKQEFIDLLDAHKAIGINAVIVQIRPAADAFYHSQLEPWSKWLTGKTGKYPYPFYDPLQFMVEEAHARGLEFHAWFNPYRALINYEETGIDSASLVFNHPEWFVPYGKNLYFDPGLPEAREHTIRVIADVVNRYAIDGVHFDDYFYPYRISNLEFPDSASFKKYGGEFSNREDWRRNNVDLLIKSLSDRIKQDKPHVQFGISPFGVWRNKSADPSGSDTRAGQTCYDDLYADVLKWLREGWIDYVVPQLYWHIGHKAAPYEVLAPWWNENSFGKRLYIGHAAYRAGNASDSVWRSYEPISTQLQMNKALPQISGSVFFSSKSLTRNNANLSTRLKELNYKYPAITPQLFMVKEELKSDYKLFFSASEKNLRILWTESNQEPTSVIRYILYRFNSGEKINLDDPSKIIAVLPNTNYSPSLSNFFIDQTIGFKRKYTYVLTSLDRFNNESKPELSYPVKVSRKSLRQYSPNHVIEPK